MAVFVAMHVHDACVGAVTIKDGDVVIFRTDMKATSTQPVLDAARGLEAALEDMGVEPAAILLMPLWGNIESLDEDMMRDHGWRKIRPKD